MLVHPIDGLRDGQIKFHESIDREVRPRLPESWIRGARHTGGRSYSPGSWGHPCPPAIESAQYREGTSVVSGPRISVIIPTFGRSALLGETLRSVEMQTYPAAEVLVIDDCSPEPVELPSGLDLNTRLLRLPRNQGPGTARNTGLAHATGDWLVFLDDDDLLTPRRLQLAVGGMGQARAHAAAVALFWPDGRTRRYDAKYFEGDLRRTFNHGPHPSMGQVVHRREDVVKFGPMRVSEDTEWWLRMRHAAHFAWSPEIGLLMRRHPESRPGVEADSRYHSRRRIAELHAASSDRRTRARLYGDVAAAALLCGERKQARAWAARSLVQYPRALQAKRLARSVLPRK